MIYPLEFLPLWNSMQTTLYSIEREREGEGERERERAFLMIHMCYNLNYFDLQNGAKPDSWHLTPINVKQWEYLTNRISQHKSKESYTLDPNDKILKSVKNIKDLGITISYDLLWSDHVHEVVNKAKKVLGVINQCTGEGGGWGGGWSKNELRAIAVLNERWVKVKPGKDSLRVGLIFTY